MKLSDNLLEKIIRLEKKEGTADPSLKLLKPAASLAEASAKGKRHDDDDAREAGHLALHGRGEPLHDALGLECSGHGE